MNVAGRSDPLVLSPMVDVTDAAFRSLAIECGADVTCSEMVAAAGLVHGNTTSWRHVEPWPGEHPYGIQFMTGDAGEMALAAAAVAERVHPDFVDVNLGCPAPNILRACGGGFLLNDPARAGAVVRAAREAADSAGVRYVSAKMRTGPDGDHPTYLDVARECVDAGADWLVLHGRSVAQGYTGTADWSAIARLVRHVDVPVIGNGDLREPADVVRMQAETDCAGFFIARAAMHDPTVFARMRAALDGKEPGPGPTLEERLALAARYVERARAIGIGDPGTLRRQVMRFASGVPGAKALRRSLHEAKDAEGVLSVIAQASGRSLEVAAQDGHQREAGEQDRPHAG